MDFIIQPQDSVVLRIDFRYLGEQGIRYDGLSFYTFPTRQGFTLDHRGRLSLQELHQHQNGSESSFLQAWLFFGLMQEFFGQNYKHDEYIVESEGSSLGLAHVERLMMMLKEKQSELLHLEAEDPEAADMERSRLHELIHDAAHCCAELDHSFEEITDPAWPITLLSVKLLIQTLDTDLSLDLQLHKPLDIKAPSIFCLKDAMLKEGGWCYHHVEELSSANTYRTLFFLASLRRYPGPWIDHSECHTKDQCTAYNVNEATHRTLHIDDGCNCPSIKAPDTNLDIIDSGNIPFVQCERRKGELPKIMHGVVRPGTKYVAISHIWSDGLGNLLANELPLCQLERILDRVEALHLEIGSGSSTSLTQMLQQNYKSLRDKILGRQPVQINFWMDVFCNPVVPPGCDPDRAEHLKRVLATGISRLLPTYIFAEYVLILDHEVQQATLSQSKTELLSRLAVSGWRSRCWTHQEYCFSKIPVFQCVDGLGPPLRDEHSSKVKPANMEERVRQELENLAPIALHSTFGIQDPLDNLSLPGLGFTSTSPEDLENQRSVRFIQVWNDLSRKNITHNYDSLEILANLLELRAGDLLGLSTKDQMKAVLGSHQKLPLDLLFTSTKRYVDVEDDRWIPYFPKGGEPLREGTLQIYLTSLGPLIPSSHFENSERNKDNHRVEQSCSIMALKVLNASGCSWTLEVPNANNEAEKHVWVSLQDNAGGRASEIPDNTNVVFILDTSPSVLHTTTQRGRRGCCLIKKKCATSQHPIQTSYACPVLWGHANGSKYHGVEAAEGELLSTLSPDILINSNVADWLHVEPRQNLFMPASFASDISVTLLQAFHFTAIPIWVLGSMLGLGPSLVMQPWIFVAMLLIFEIVLSWTAYGIAGACQQRANDYLQLQSFHPDWSADEPLLTRLQKAFSESDGSSPWRTRIILRILKCIIWLYVKGW